jgi:hypothetical protein
MDAVDSLILFQLTQKLNIYEPTLLYQSKYQICPYCKHIIEKDVIQVDNSFEPIYIIMISMLVVFVICIILTIYFYFKGKK